MELRIKLYIAWKSIKRWLQISRANSLNWSANWVLPVKVRVVDCTLKALMQCSTQTCSVISRAVSCPHRYGSGAMIVFSLQKNEVAYSTPGNAPFYFASCLQWHPLSSFCFPSFLKVKASQVWLTRKVGQKHMPGTPNNSYAHHHLR